MDDKTQEAINRNLGKGGWLELIQKSEDGTETTDKIWLEQLDITYIGKILKILATFEKSGLSEDKFMEYIGSSENVDIVNELCFSTLKTSYPDMTDETINKFIVANWLPLIQTIFKINNLGSGKISSGGIEAIKRKEHVEQLRKNYELRRKDDVPEKKAD